MRTLVLLLAFSGCALDLNGTGPIPDLPANDAQADDAQAPAAHAPIDTDAGLLLVHCQQTCQLGCCTAAGFCMLGNTDSACGLSVTQCKDCGAGHCNAYGWCEQ